MKDSVFSKSYIQTFTKEKEEELIKKGYRLFLLNDYNLLISYYLEKGKIYIKEISTPFSRGKEKE